MESRKNGTGCGSPALSPIYFIRGEKVMLDVDLARLYDTETRILKQAVRRNINSESVSNSLSGLRASLLKKHHT